MSPLRGTSIAVRTDASLAIGTGHVMRCLTLARALAARGAEVTFFCRAHEGHLARKIEELGFSCRLLPPGSAEVCVGDPPHAAWLGARWDEDAAMMQAAMAGPVDLLVVDHYALDRRWEAAMRPLAARILAIDDLADRPRDADLLLDQNLGRAAGDYEALVPASCRVLAGPRFALLRPEFARMRPAALARRRAWTGPCHLLVSMGGVDAPNVTGRTLDCLAAGAPLFREITIVLGAAAPHRQAVEAAARRLDAWVSIVQDASNMAELMTGADIAVGAAGATAWERCCLGLPTLSVVMAENQAAPARNLLAAGALLGALEVEELEPGLVRRLLDPTAERYAGVSAAAAAVCDGEGVERVLAEIEG